MDRIQTSGVWDTGSTPVEGTNIKLSDFLPTDSAALRAAEYEKPERKKGYLKTSSPAKRALPTILLLRLS